LKSLAAIGDDQVDPAVFNGGTFAKLRATSRSGSNASRLEGVDERVLEAKAALDRFPVTWDPNVEKVLAVCRSVLGEALHDLASSVTRPLVGHRSVPNGSVRLTIMAFSCKR
jgi:hypothetical protein